MKVLPGAAGALETVTEPSAKINPFRTVKTHAGAAHKEEYAQKSIHRHIRDLSSGANV